jgi:hypothetical protein
MHSRTYLGKFCRIRDRMQVEQVCLTEFENARTDRARSKPEI